MKLKVLLSKIKSIYKTHLRTSEHGSNKLQHIGRLDKTYVRV